MHFGTFGTFFSKNILYIEYYTASQLILHFYFLAPSEMHVAPFVGDAGRGIGGWGLLFAKFEV